MHLVVSLVVVAAVIAAWAQVCVWLGQWQESRAHGEAGRRTARTRRSRGPVLPEGHRPPAGLGPLSPSERFLTAEASRGLRDLQTYLLEQQAAPEER